MIRERFPGAVNPNANVEADDLLDSSPITANYVPWGSYGMYGYYSFYNRNRPPFSYMTIREMLCDPRITFGLWLLKGPIVSSPTFEVKTTNPQVEKFIQMNLQRFWANSAVRALKALEWGFSASEVLYRYNSEDGAIHFDTIRDLEPLDCRPVTLKGRIVGFSIRNIVQSHDYLGTSEPMGPKQPGSLEMLGDSKHGRDPSGNLYIGSPRCLYHLHLRERNPWFGLSRLFGAHVPWWEQWSEDGYRAIRRLWFAKNAFEGGVVYHPAGTIATKQGPMAARDYAREMIEKKRTGGVLTLPNTVGPDGSGRAWEYIPPQGNPVPAGLLDYGALLKDEVLEGMGIPPEIIQSSGETGFGSASGRQVPQMAFYSLLLELKHWLVLDFDAHVLRYLVTLNFGNAQYEIISKSLMEEKVQPSPNDPYAGQNPLDQMEATGEVPPDQTGELSPEEAAALQSEAA